MLDSVLLYIPQDRARNPKTSTGSHDFPTAGTKTFRYQKYFYTISSSKILQRISESALLQKNDFIGMTKHNHRNKYIVSI